MPDAPAAVAAPPSRVLRVFVSSTFRDMQAERDLLVKTVFPQLRKLCEARAVTWGEVDLRWGITDEETAEGQVLPLCLAEIRKCRPYFIGLLGERYGSLPTAIPGDLLETESWLAEHRDDSVTALEILHGVLNDPALADRALFYFRDPAYLDHLPPGADRADFASESPAAAAKLAALKARIRAAHAAGHLAYAPREPYADPPALAERVLADLTAVIDSRYPADAVPDPLDQEALRHEAYAQTRRLGFVGRDDLLGRIDAHVVGRDTGALVLSGESGAGKSALLAEWVARWRDAHPDDLIVQHYIGSTVESADWQGLVRRILSELQRAFAIPDDLPLEPDALRTALGEWLVKAAGARRVVLVLDALNQLSADDPTARQLGWLPVVAPPNVRVVVSSLPGEPLEAARRRSWPELAVPLFGRDDIRPAAVTYCALFGKKLPEQTLNDLAATPTAQNPLFLRAVLDELRQFGEHRRLAERAAWYLAAPDLPALYDRVLTRWHDDFGQDPQYPDLVRRSLCLLACARFGLSEAELLDLLGSDGAPLPRRPWTPFQLAAESALAIRGGGLTFGHEHLRTAVQHRWLSAPDAARPWRQHLAGYFAAMPEPTDRQLDELPALWRDMAEWDRLKELLADIPTFLRLRAHERWTWELHGYWLALAGHFDPVDVYQDALTGSEASFSAERLSDIIHELASFHLDAGRYASAEPLYRRALGVRERTLGPEHLDTLASLNQLAWLLDRRGAYGAAEPLYQRALAVRERLLGAEHPDTLGSVNNLAILLESKGDYGGAEALYRRALAGWERVLGAEHPYTLTCVNNLAGLPLRRGDYTAAETLFRRALAGRERVLGVDNPRTLESVNNLAVLLERRGDYASAELLHQRALAGLERVLGAEHPSTLLSVNNLAAVLQQTSYAAAEPLYRRAFAGLEQVLGAEHPDTLTAGYNLACLMGLQGDYAAAEALHRRVLSAQERELGADHLATALSASKLAGLLERTGNSAAAEPLYRRALAVEERVRGPEHPDTLTSVSSLASLLARTGDYAAAEPLSRRALAGRERVLGPDHPDTINSARQLASLLQDTGHLAEAEPLLRRSRDKRGLRLAQSMRSIASGVVGHARGILGTLAARRGNTAAARRHFGAALRPLLKGCDNAFLEALLQHVSKPQYSFVAFQLYKDGDYAHAQKSLELLLAAGFNVLSTRVHLARIALVTDRVDAAQDHVAQVWDLRSEAAPYVVPRILWLQLALALLPPTPQPDVPAPRVVLGRLKTALARDGAHAEWTMDPVLAHLQSKVAPEDHALLTALVAALGDASHLPDLDRFPAWRDAEPQPLE